MHLNQKFLNKIKELGYCCPWEFFRQMSGYSTLAMANYLGIRARTVRFWKARAQACESNRNCQNHPT